MPLGTKCFTHQRTKGLVQGPVQPKQPHLDSCSWCMKEIQHIVWQDETGWIQDDQATIAMIAASLCCHTWSVRPIAIVHYLIQCTPQFWLQRILAAERLLHAAASVQQQLCRRKHIFTTISTRIFISKVKGKLPGRLMIVDQNRNRFFTLSIVDHHNSLSYPLQVTDRSQHSATTEFCSSYFQVLFSSCSYIQHLTTWILTRSFVLHFLRRHYPSHGQENWQRNLMSRKNDNFYWMHANYYP